MMRRLAQHCGHKQIQSISKGTSSIVRLIENDVSIDSKINVGNYVWIRYGSRIKTCQIGYMSFIGFNCRIENTTIGSHCQIATGVCIGSANAYQTTIDNNVWIGARACIIPGVNIASGAIIGAGAYVTQDVDKNTVVIGRPAVAIKKRVYIDDAFPDFTDIISLKLKRLQDCYKNKIISSNKIGKSCYLDVDIECRSDFEIEQNVIIIGRRDGPSIDGGLRLGDNIKIQQKCVIEAAGGIDVGDQTTIGEDTLLISNTHDMKYKSLPWRSAKIKIGRNVIIGRGSTIIGPSCIHDNSIIMPNSLIIGKDCTEKYTFGLFGHP